MSNRDKSSRRGLTGTVYTDSVETRLRNANEQLVINNSNYRWVSVGIELFPIDANYVEKYYKLINSEKKK